MEQKKDLINMAMGTGSTVLPVNGDQVSRPTTLTLKEEVVTTSTNCSPMMGHERVRHIPSRTQMISQLKQNQALELETQRQTASLAHQTSPLQRSPPRSGTPPVNTVEDLPSAGRMLHKLSQQLATEIDVTGQALEESRQLSPLELAGRKLAESQSNVLKRKLTDSTDSPTLALGEPPLKRSRPSLVRPKFDVRYADHLVHLGNARYVLCGTIEDKIIIRIQECDHRSYHGGDFKQPKMVKLDVQQWLDMMSEDEVINAAIDEFDEVKIPIGGNTFVRVQPHRQRVDIREYFLPEVSANNLQIAPDQFENLLLPTKRGISLTYEEWDNLADRAAPLIVAGCEVLRSAKQGACISHHNGQMSWFKCSHCNPNGYKAWV